MARILGLDVGDKKIGVAISDPLNILATPAKTVIRVDDETAIIAIKDLMKKYNAEKIVMGLPYSLDGTIGKQAEKVISFRDKLLSMLPVSIAMQDERLSTIAAEQKLREAGQKRTKLIKKIDAAAATVILQDYLDSLRVT